MWSFGDVQVEGSICLTFVVVSGYLAKLYRGGGEQSFLQRVLEYGAVSSKGGAHWGFSLPYTDDVEVARSMLQTRTERWFSQAAQADTTRALDIFGDKAGLTADPAL